MRVALVNGVPVMVELLRRIVTGCGAHEIAWVARDGADAVRKAVEDRPDVILMDLTLPVLDGAEATKRIMEIAPCAVMIVTASVAENANKVYQALGHGALDSVQSPCVSRDGGVRGAEELLAKLETIGRIIGPGASRASSPEGVVEKTSPPALPPLVVVGSSTGGPQALAQMFSAFPADFPAAVIVAQHVDVYFVAGLADWLAGQTQLAVRLAREGDVPEKGTVLLAGTNDHLVLDSAGRVAYTAEPREIPYRPSVDVFFQSVARVWREPGVGVLLTGMGKDGAAGLKALRAAGWHTIAQDEKTSVVYGMPKAAAMCDAAVRILPIERIADGILGQLRYC